MLSWQAKALKMREENISWAEISKALADELPEYDAHTRQQKIRDWVRKQPGYKQSHIGQAAGKASMSYDRRTGTTTYEAIISLPFGQEVTPEAVMQAHNLDPLRWDVISYKSNYWQSQAKGGVKMDLYQSKITVKPRDSQIDYTAIEKYFAGKDWPRRPTIKPEQYDAAGEILEICIPDLHSGLLSWRAETGEDYDSNIVKARFYGCISDILFRCAGRKFRKILFVTLGDLLHADNNQQTTTKGTFQNCDSRFSKYFTDTLDLLIEAITALEAVAPVEVIYVAGNHDELTGFTLLKSVEMAFRADENVQVDAAPNPRKWRRLGNVLVGWCHGDMPKKLRTAWLQQEAREAYGQTLYAEVHAGHLHSQQGTEEENGIILRHLPTLCSSSYWEHKQGFAKSVKAIVSFVWNEETGLRDIWMANVKPKRSLEAIRNEYPQYPKEPAS